jgi:serine/threonine protein kinase
MGCKPSNLVSHEVSSPKSLIDKQDFVTGGLLGEGGFGKVWTAMLIKNSSWYAIKEIKKSELLKHKCGLAMLSGELEAMKRIDHPSLINLHFAFQDKKRCYFVLDLKIGGDLRYYLKRRYVFEESDVAFYVACLSSALDHMHSRNIIHRDLKPGKIHWNKLPIYHLFYNPNIFLMYIYNREYYI